MSLFSKLKSRLTKSSSKLDQGLEAIVEDGGQESGADEAFAEEVTTPDVPDEIPATTPIEAPVMQEPMPAPTPTEIPENIPAEMPQETVAPIEIPTSQIEEVVEAAPETTKPGFLGRLIGRKETKTVTRRVLDDDMLEQLEELLITADMGVETSMRVTAAMAEGRFGKKLSVEEIKRLMAREIARIMEPVAKPMPIYAKTPQVVLVVGVNGSGKTTTIGKLASQFKAAGKSVVIAAGDTFRAAAVEQLQVWGERAGVPVLTAPEGSDPASLAFDAMTKAQESGADLLMIDTAGRLQNRQDLMEELAKIVRVIRKKDESAPHNTLLVLDATTGQNAISQVETFQKLADVSGLVMTKLDGTARGGVLVSLADKFGLPIHAIGVGEQIDDLAPFDPEEFAAALTGLEV
ncbi:signal recognition particle-docking protein FtsY [Celeribacter litoreus]|uniref:signal recognition particle-docking protein FtsY n=1 Tax=Celeribacter litoreus TaxID=2876714 RepID=UPI001CCC4F29|nr:signal recognition particle-docking protein FtsY [Celeribacter litoreus]MCA0045202.1 signal recognition particle-docking protein FtsY [Celeribacter litoreus]